MILRLFMNNYITESEAIELGLSCQKLMDDPDFVKVVDLCEKNLSLEVLAGANTSEREATYYTYQGLKRFIEMMQQFVIVKDQVVAQKEQEEIKE
jgi:hypothetical protein